jgi:PAS domain S-box-containing protein
MYSPFSKKFSPKTQPSGKVSKDEALMRMKLAYEGNSQNFEWMHLTQNGKPFYVKINLTKYDYKGERYLMAILKDITDKYDYIEQMKEKEYITNLLFEQSTTSALKFDSYNNITAYNDAFSKLFRINSDILNKNINLVLQNTELEKLIRSSRESHTQTKNIHFFMDSKANSFEAQVKILAFAENSQEAGGIILFEETNKIAELKVDIDKDQNNFEEIISKSQDIIYKYSIKDKKYVYLSKSVENIFGYTAIEISDMSEKEIEAIIHPDDLSRSNVLLTRFFNPEQKDTEQQVEYKIIHKSGVIKWVKDSYSIIKDENGEAIAVIGVISDLTSQKEDGLFIKHKEKLLQIMTENISQGITVIIENKIQLVNTNLTNITGYSKEELNNVESLFIFAAEQEKIRLKNDYIKVISGSAQINELSYWFTKKSGENIFIKNQYFLDSENSGNRYILTTNETQEILKKYKENPTEKIKKELETYLGDFDA